jgi:hypothetical protein
MLAPPAFHLDQGLSTKVSEHLAVQGEANALLFGV